MGTIRRSPSSAFAAMPTLSSGLTCTIRVNGLVLPEYKPIIAPSPTGGVTLTCWIESHPGQEFIVSFGHKLGPQAHVGRVSLDGDVRPAEACEGDEEGGRGAREGVGG